MAEIIAFIPARGGSKSIPLKNIKEICGQPLIYWNILSLHQTARVSRIVVSTDSDEIAKVVLGFGFPEVEVYQRSAATASDTASTESAMLEYLEDDKRLSPDDIFILVQATSPLTLSQHFTEALSVYAKGQYDSLLTCVRLKRLFWRENGTPANYDYQNRSRRQDLTGELMENGAFYISKVKNILESKNRLSGKIGIYTMPDYTAVEIDEEDDWPLAETLVRKYVLPNYRPNRKPIKLVAMDVDGVLTDAGMYYSEKGDELKKFSTYDGKAVELLRNQNLKTAILTSEDTKIVAARARKLKIDFVVQGAKDKVQVLSKIIKQEKISWAEVAYVGDDLNDLELLNKVGRPACPKNATQAVKNVTDIICLDTRGGAGALREFADILLKEIELSTLFRIIHPSVG
jgi:N-acylneuraminate cytidylyltransferase